MRRRRNHIYLFCAFIAICTSAIMASAWGVDPLAVILILFGMSFGTVCFCAWLQLLGECG